MRKRSKAKSQKSHCLRRFRERYGISITDNDYQIIVKMIQDGKATCIEKQSNRVSVFEIDYRGEKLQVCYDKNSKQISTVLPPPGSWSQTSVLRRVNDEAEQTQDS